MREDHGCFRHGKDPTSVGILLGGKFKNLYQCRSLIWTKIIWLTSLSSPSNRSTSRGQVSKPFHWRPTHLSPFPHCGMSPPGIYRRLVVIPPGLPRARDELRPKFDTRSDFYTFHILPTREPIENLTLAWRCRTMILSPLLRSLVHRSWGLGLDSAAEFVHPI